MKHSNRTASRTLAGLFAAAAVLGLAAVPAAAQDKAERAPTTGSHIDPNARPVMLDPVYVGGATEAGRAVPLDASEKQAAERPAIAEVDAAQWLPADEAKSRN